MDLNFLANRSTIFYTLHSTVNQKSMSLQQEALQLLHGMKQKGSKSQKFLQIQKKKTIPIPIQNKNYKLLVLPQPTTITLFLYLANLEISGIYDLATPLQPFSASSISSSQHLTLASAFHVSAPRKLVNLSLHQSQKLKSNWNEYTPISVDNFQTLRTILPTISSLSMKSHHGHILSTSKTSLLPLSKKNSQNTSQKSNDKLA